MSADRKGLTDSDTERTSATESADDSSAADPQAIDRSVSEVNEPEQGSAAEQSSRQQTFSRRALIAAGWAVPVILAVGLPPGALAQAVQCSPPSSHFDFNHVDDDNPEHLDDHGDHDDAATGHGDVHIDELGGHGDSPHEDECL